MVKLRDTPCERCGWKYPGFHICVDLSRPLDPAIAKKHRPQPSHIRSEALIQMLQDGRAKRWERHREEMAERDAEIVRLYKTGLGFRVLAAQFGIAYQTARNVIRRAEANGEVVVRDPGGGSHQGRAV